MPEELTEAEKKKRLTHVMNAINSVELEGFKISDEQHARFMQYATGELTLKELNDITKAQYGTKN